MVELLRQPWPWYLAGPLIALTMLLMVYFGKKFGISSTLRTACAMGGAGRFSKFFDFDWKKKSWSLVFVLGMFVGGFIAATWIQQPEPIPLAENTVQKLRNMGIQSPGEAYIPLEFFSWEGLSTGPGFILMVLGGFLVGFGARYASGCTSGHAISGLSNLQL